MQGGDLSLGGPGGFSTVTGTQKLIQDLRNWILEPRGTDPDHPEYGSVLDGGTLPDGTVLESPVGSILDASVIMNMESEIRRILTAYQQQQLDRLQRESALYNGKNTFAPGEILYSIDKVDVQQYIDVAIATVTITTSSGQIVPFNVPITG